MSEKHAYRILIVDDEQPARQRLRELMDNDPDVRDIMEVENGLDAVEAILQKQPDVVFPRRSNAGTRWPRCDRYDRHRAKCR